MQSLYRAVMLEAALAISGASTDRFMAVSFINGDITAQEIPSLPGHMSATVFRNDLVAWVDYCLSESTWGHQNIKQLMPSAVVQSNFSSSDTILGGTVV